MNNLKTKMKLTVLASFFIFSISIAQNFYDVSSLQKIELTFPSSNWDYLLDTSKYGSDDYVLATQLKVNGIIFDSVGVKFKGNSSYDSTYTKNPLHIELDAFKNQNFNGITDIKLGNGYDDPSLIREVLSYNILNNYMDCPRANFAQVYVNGNYIGLYSNEENISKKFCANKLSTSSSNTFIKCNPIVNPGVATKCSLRYLTGVDSTGYYNFYEVKSSNGYNELKNLCDSVSNNTSSISNAVDLDKFIWMLAFDNLLVNLDSYSGAFSQNYYLFKDNAKRFSPFVWDLNMSFGGFPFAGSGAFSLNTLNVQGMQQMPHTLHSTDSNWPMLKAILNNSSQKKMYVAHIRTMMNEMFANNLYLNTANQFRSLIDTAVASDGNAFFNYSQYQTSLDSNVAVSGRVVPGITNLMTARLAYLQSLPDFTAAPPTITNVSSSNQSPSLNSVVTITATITNANSSSVYIGYRYNTSDKFERGLMYDDGTHNDGAANDNVYGANMFLAFSNTQYYLYAENSDAGMFSPERAEHEFYTLQTTQQNLAVGDITINEFVANNIAGYTNESGTHEDWIELYNNTNNAIDLNGLYLSDSINFATKFAFVANTIIQPHQYLTVWADGKNSTSQHVHCNFKLSSTGESIMLSNGNGLVLDSISFGAQTADVSVARCPNGMGSFVTTISPTFNASNCSDGITENKNTVTEFTLSPNPAADFVVINCKQQTTQNIIITSALGQVVFNETFTSNSFKVNTTSYQNGMYFVRVGNTNKKLLIAR